jgi:hypothetical protein
MNKIPKHITPGLAAWQLFLERRNGKSQRFAFYTFRYVQRVLGNPRMRHGELGRDIENEGTPKFYPIIVTMLASVKPEVNYAVPGYTLAEM